MTPVTVLGLGPMGRALAAAFAAAGHPTTVWNRTPGKAAGLDVAVAGTAAAAIAASPLVVVCVRDHAAARSVLDVGVPAGRTLVDFTGGSPAQARAMAAWAGERGVDHLDGVVVATPEAVGGPGAVLFYSGPGGVYEAHRSTLAALGGNATYLGEDPGRAAAFDASLQDLFWTAMSGVVHMFALAGAEGIGAVEVAGHAKAVLGFFPDLVDQVAGQVAAGSFPGADATIGSVAGVLDTILGTVRAHGLDNGVLTAVRAEVGRAVEAGYGAEGFGRLAAPRS
ncbi:NAD(P)-binding domain-containing protein [Saccharothrix australiensis]|uniref:3-hydroxyisobutyrate dehydrogenase-like beta-hydroxyacid dehydrogenase n=1 Tax=Saccharothrix australiensis TaxID=2072 RepID=A0A495VZU3_9PSEU|nr:NAD(P)-binding domain-containing protein [Saccharothrix australiensis]RKT54972.1 3-hydroxyisobutyrate dehydrogenase-like beta-hydroxyacid dehydrogenase [Saccharothrix australiensis]